MEDLIERLLDEIDVHKQKITGVRRANRQDEGRVAGMAALLEGVRMDRGRPLFYAYIGSGMGNGALVELADGSVKWDFITGIGTNFFGHSDRQFMRKAVRAALSDVPIQGHLQPNAEYVRFLSTLTKNVPGRCKHAWPSMSGTLANENALKLIRQKKHPAWRVLAFQGAFAGRSTTLSEITDNDLNKKGQPTLGQACHLPFYDPANPLSTAHTLEKLDEALLRHPGEFCAIHVELIQGEGGFREAPAEFFRPVFDRCRRAGVAIWVDEIQTFGRTGELYALDRLGLSDWADVVTIGKMLCGSACFFTAELNPEPGLISGTFAGYTAGLALGSDVIRRLKEEGYLGPAGKIRKLEVALADRMRSLRDKQLIQDYTVVGTMAALTPNQSDLQSVQRLVRTLFDAGLCTYYGGHAPRCRLRMLLPGCLAPSDLAEPFAILEQVLKDPA